MRTSRFLLLFILSLAGLGRLHATHNRAGEITYTRIAPFFTVVEGFQVDVYNYKIVIITYTDDGPGIADRCVDTLYFGDGERGIARRVNGLVNGCCNSINPNIPCGEVIISEPGYKVKRNVYEIEHRFPGPGVYMLRCLDPNRNGGVVNIPNSVNQPFYIESFLIINSFTGANSSPVLNNAPIDRACVGECFQHNPAAYDADHDSLSFEITASRGASGSTVTGYTYPNAGGGTFSINPVTGLLVWCNPNAQGEYNIAFIVKEWRKNTNGIYQLIGYVLRDMQVIVSVCPNEYPPVVTVPQDTCVEAGALIVKEIYAKNFNNGTRLYLEGAGGGLSAINPWATFTATNAITYTATGGNISSTFRWQTDCNHISSQPYYTTFKAEALGQSSKIRHVAFATYAIRIIPPSVKNVTAVPLGSSMQVSWSLSSCNPSTNPIKEYRIYRKNDCSPFVFDPCATGIPISSGFELVGTVGPRVSTFVDSNGGDGLVVGQSYSYLVVAVYSDKTQTFGSAQVCGKLKRDVPVMLKVDVLSTSPSSGTIGLAWMRPVIGPDNLDTNAFKGPYQFNLKHLNTSGVMETVFNSTKSTIAQLETLYVHKDINTQDLGHEYLVEFIAGGKTVGTSQKASSVFLSATPADRKVELTWSVKTPWKNTKYTISRKDPGASTFTTIATATEARYTDKTDIVNGFTYCYFVTSEGAYSDPTILKPLINRSQETCAKAKDMTPPCSPTISLDADCPTSYVKVTWTNVKTGCPESDDVLTYKLFYKPTVNDEYGMVATISHTANLEYIPDGISLISGCYAVQAIDSAGNASALSPDFCIDNCPEFELPNIFTPNGDNANDFFKAIRVRQITQINLDVFDRWGNKVYTTHDPYFKWDGISIFTKEKVSEGTFFYICDVFEPRLKGIVKRTLKGTVTVVR